MMERWEVEEWVAVEGKVLHDEVMRMSGGMAVMDVR